MEQDTAREPVDLSGAGGLSAEVEFMDTGVLYEERICTECGDDLACQGYRMCSECLEKAGHAGE